MAVNVKMGVDLGGFKSGIQQGTQILKGLNAEMKATEAEFKATGNAEQKMASQTKNLTSQIQVQKGIVDQAQKALDAMAKAGIDPADKAYQQMYATMMKAQQGMYEAQAALNSLGESAQQAAGGANELVTSVNSIGKKISLDQVISGIGSITGALETAAGKAVQLGEAIWNAVMDSARLSDDILTQAGILDMTPEKYQQYKGVFNTIGEITITEWAATKRKIEKAMTGPSSDQIDVLKALGFTEYRSMGKYGGHEETVRIADNWEDVFWEVGSELQRRVESGQLSSAMADVYGEALFGKKYSNMKNLIRLGKEGFEAALKEQNTISDEALEKNAALNDQVIKLQDSFDALKAEVTSALAPALTDAAKALDGVLSSVLEYLKTDKGKEMLQSLGDAVSGLFGDLSKLDPDKVVSGFVDVFTKVTGGIQWLVDNAETAKGILATIVGAWGALKLGETVLKVVKLVDGISGLTASSAAEAGAAAGGSWASAFASAAMKAAPFLAFLYTMLKPGDTAGNDLDTLFANGRVTTAGWEAWNNMPDEWNRRLMLVGNRYGALSELMNNDVALNIIGNHTIDMDEVYRQLEEQLGLEPLDVPYEMTPQENVTEQITEQVGVVEIPAQLVVTGVNMGGGGGGGKPVVLMKHANGLPFVPYDGYLAYLHRGERVMTASQNRNYTYNSNNYFGNVNLNNGQDIDALCDRIDQRNRRQMSGFGA